MNNSIFDLENIFNYQSPFGNWLSEPPIVKFQILNFEYIEENDAQGKTKDLIKINFTIETNFDDPKALIVLHTNEIGSNDINLKKEVNTTPIKKGINEFSIKFIKTAYDTHFLRTNGNLDFYFTLLSNEITYKGTLFKVKAIKMLINSITTIKSLKVIEFEYKSVGLLNQKVIIQFYQKIGGKDEVITGLSKEILIDKSIKNEKISILESVIANRLIKNKSSIYVLYSSVDGIEFKTEDLDLSKDFVKGTSESCGIEYRDQIYCIQFGKKFGPRFRGELTLKNYPAWSSLIADGRVTERDKVILIAMSENEGNLDAVQGYDDQIITVGAMQKVIDPTGSGEFAQQMYEFSQSNPSLFKSLFSDCGWEAEYKSGQYKAYYKNVTGSDLKLLITKGFISSKKSKTVVCIPVEPLINACKNAEFQAKQLEDFINRLEVYLNKKPVGYDEKIIEFVKTNLGRATVLDHSVNRPGHVIEYFAQALKLFFKKYPSIPKKPELWAKNHNSYEQKFLDIYGPLRETKTTSSVGNPLNGMTNGKSRYESLKTKLPIQ